MSFPQFPRHPIVYPHPGQIPLSCAENIAANKDVIEGSPSDQAGPSKKRKLASAASSEKPKNQHIYLVIFQEYGPDTETETKNCGAYTTMKDANNKIFDLWQTWPWNDCHETDDGSAYDEVEADGRISWNAADEEDGIGAKAWIEKQLLVEETNDEVKDWGGNRPGRPIDDSESGEELPGRGYPYSSPYPAQPLDTNRLGGPIDDKKPSVENGGPRYQYPSP